MPLDAAAVPAIKADIRTRRTLTLEVGGGEPVAKVQPIQGDDWAQYASWIGRRFNPGKRRVP